MLIIKWSKYRVFTLLKFEPLVQYLGFSLTLQIMRFYLIFININLSTLNVYLAQMATAYTIETENREDNYELELS